jgi:type II secretory pathway pseudopilin PulG
MLEETPPLSYLSCGVSERRERSGIRGFTLVETLIASFIVTVTIGIAMTAFVSLLQQNRQAEETEIANQQMRRLLDTVTRAIRSSPAAPLVMDASGCSIRLAATTKYYAMVAGTTTIDSVSHTQGISTDSDTILFQVKTPQPAPYWILAGASCPSAAIDDIGTLFTDATSLPTIDVSQMFAVGDVVAIPQTGFGDATNLTIRSVDASLNPQRVRFTTAIGRNIPNGTMIANTAGVRIRFVIVANPTAEFARGDFVMYPNDQDLTQYSVLGRNLDPTPRVDPSDASVTETPFSYDPASRQFVINFQYLPAGNSIAGRITMGTRSFVQVRTDPASL